MRKLFASILLAWALLVSLTPLSLADSLTTRNTYGRSQLASDLQVVPDSTTSLSTTDTWVFQLTITNVTGSAATFTMSNRATSALDLFKTVSIAANTTYIVSFPEGVKMKNGISWSAGTTSALNASVIAFKVP